MQLSRFVVTYPDLRPGEHVLYSVLEDRYAGVDDATLRAIERWKNGESPQDDEEREIQAALVEDGLLVEGRAEDDARLRAHLDKASEGVPGTLYVTLMPTLRCNLACTYCFQKEHPAFERMSSPTEDATLEWILRQIDERALPRLHIHYFGGEPTTRKDFCLHTAEVLSAAMKARGGVFDWKMTTNGIELDLAFARKMDSFGRGAFKVTLDGDKETHDRMRVYRDGRGSFDVIFENVAALARDGIRVVVGGHFFPDQAPSFEKLLDRLEQTGVGRLLAGVQFRPMEDTQRTSGGTCTDCSAQQETQTLVQLNKSIDRRKLMPAKFKGDALQGLLGPCELHWKNNYTIDPDGRVYKCPVVAGIPGLEVAQVASAEPEKVAPLVELRPWEKCGDCPYLPVCVGGCLGSKYLKTGRRDQVACKLEMFEATFRESVTHRYLEEFSEPSWAQAA
ncbi:MAG TPA: radical SAM protein [Myxococcales bacterium]